MPITQVLLVLLRAAGVSMIVLAFAHIILPRLLNWTEDLGKLSPINKQIFISHALFIVIGILLLGGVCVVFPQGLIEKSQLATVASACFAMCWLSRLVLQFALFTGTLTGSNQLDMLVRIGGTLLWIFYSGVFCLLFAHQIGLLAESI